jgi:hypothetical protein
LCGLAARAQVAALKSGQLPEAGEIMNGRDAPAYGEQLPFTQLAQGSVNVDGCQPKGIGQDELTERASEFGLCSEPD